MTTFTSHLNFHNTVLKRTSFVKMLNSFINSPDAWACKLFPFAAFVINVINFLSVFYLVNSFVSDFSIYLNFIISCFFCTS